MPTGPCGTYGALTQTLTLDAGDQGEFQTSPRGRPTCSANCHTQQRIPASSHGAGGSLGLALPPGPCWLLTPFTEKPGVGEWKEEGIVWEILNGDV